MKKSFLFCALLALSIFSVALIRAEYIGSPTASAMDFTLTPNATAVSANTTNSTAGTSYQVIAPVRGMRLWITATGVGGTTNDVTVFIDSSPDNVTWETSTSDLIKVVIPMNGATTITKSDWFDLVGVRYLRVGRIENPSAGVVSNLTFKGVLYVQ